jgi:glycosyltransferase involved in cell wall biosynthesis
MRKASEMNDYVLIDPKGLVSAYNMDSVLRHSNYSRILGNREKNSRLIIFGKQSLGSLSTENLQIFGVFSQSILRNLFSLRKMTFPKDVNPVVLIAGDPFLAFFLARKVKVKLKRDRCLSPPIQVQIHFDPKRLISSNSLLDKFKYCLTILALMTTDSLRVVNALQLQYLPKFCQTGLQVDVVPMKITYWDQGKALELSRVRPRNIGLAGRLHRERGLETFLDIIKRIPSESYSKVVIAGDGPESQPFLQKLADVIGEHRVIYLGKVNHSKMSEFWAMIGLLISCPEAESYGLTVRESLINGVPVIATRSIGISLLESEFPGDSLQVVNRNLTDLEVKSLIENAFLQRINPKELSSLLESDEKSIDTLIESWIKLKSSHNQSEV